MAGGRLPFVGAGEGGGDSFYEGEGETVPEEDDDAAESEEADTDSEGVSG